MSTAPTSSAEERDAAAKRVLFVNPPIRVREAFVDYPYFVNLGILSNAAALRAAGHEVVIVDAFALPQSGFRAHPGGGRLLGAPVDAIEAALPDGDFDAIVIGANVFLTLPLGNAEVLRLSEAVRERWPTARLILGECHVEGMYYSEYDVEAVMDRYPEVDALVRYESEEVLADALDAGAPRVTVPGADVAADALPPAAWDLIDMEAYQAFLGRVFSGPDRAGPFALAEGGATLPFTFTRGCIYRCHFCTHSPRARAAGERFLWRRLEIEQIEAELRVLKDHFGLRKVVGLDAMVNLDAKRFTRLLELLAELDLHYDFPNGLRADHLTEEHVRLMKGRIEVVSVSAESGDQRVVDEVVGKDLDLGKIRRAAELCHEHGVPIMIHFMVGLPGESRAEISQTLDFAADLYEEHRALPLVQFPTPLGGTGLSEEATRQGAWVDGNEGTARDWGALFQGEPVLRAGTEEAPVPPEELERARGVLAARLKAARDSKLIVNLTYRCNNRCVFCATGDRPSIDGGVAEHATVMRAYHDKGFKLIDFDGGEPTLHPQLCEIVGAAKKLGYERINVTTNGRLLAYPQMAQKVTHCGLTDLLFSIHGPDAKTHEDLVAVKDSFGQTMLGLRNVMRLKPSWVDVGINTTVGKRNCMSLVEVGDLAWNEGVRRLNIQFITPFGRAHKAHTPDPVRGAEQTMRLLDKYGERMKIEVINLPFCFMPGYEHSLLGDVGKLNRFMIFVGDEGVNLSDYLGDRRYRTEDCDDCSFRFSCKGFYELGHGRKASIERHNQWADEHGSVQLPEDAGRAIRHG